MGGMSRAVNEQSLPFIHEGWSLWVLEFVRQLATDITLISDIITLSSRWRCMEL